MLAKDPLQRPPDGGALAEELAAIEPFDEEMARGVALPRSMIPQGEQTLYSIVLAVPIFEASLPGSSPSTEDTSSEIIVADLALRRELEGKLLRHGLRPTWLLDGSLLLVMPPAESAPDQAARAARWALFIKSHWPIAAVALATGRGYASGEAASGGQGIIGEVVDRAANLLRKRASLSKDTPQVAAASPLSVWIDTLSASLLERRFILLPVPGGALLTGEPLPSEEARPILGCITPCVGREPELAILEAILARCQGDYEAQATLVIGAPGLGKTRLRQEFLARVRKRAQPVTVLLGVGETFSAGAPYAMLGQALRRLCGIASSDDAARARDRLLAFCVTLLGENAGEHAAPFLAELCALPFSDDSSTELRSLRGDSRTMAAALLSAFVEFLSALCERATVLLLLDDLHWGDALSVQLVDGALHKLESRPFMVLGLCRPEIKLHLPAVRRWPCLKEIPLEGLSRIASERLVRTVWGERVEQADIARIVQQAAGNALLLEELIRAEGPRREARSASREAELPATVLAILQARMQRLEPNQRLLLSKASLFGQRFSRAGVTAILEAAQVHVALEPLLEALLSSELIVAHKPSPFSEELEYSFRHPLMREAAYGLLLDEQKRYWHRVAGDFLSARHGEPDVMGLAEHYSRSDQPTCAAPYFARLALLALDGNHLQGARTYVDRGLAVSPEGETRGELLSIKSLLLSRAWEPADCLQAGEEALRLLPSGSIRWCRTFHAMLVAAMFSGDRPLMQALSQRFLAIVPNLDAMAAYLETGGVLLSALCLSAQRQAVTSLLRRMESMVGEFLEQEPSAKMWLRLGQSRRWRYLDGDPHRAWTLAEEAAAAARRLGNRRWIGIMQADAALAELDLGSPTAEAKLREALSILRELQEEVGSDYATTAAALWMSEHRQYHAEALALVGPNVTRSDGNMYFQGMRLLALSRIHAAAGWLPHAETEARAALQALSAMPPLRFGVYAQLGRVLLQQERIDEARTVVDTGLAELGALGGLGYQDLRLRLCAAEVLRAAQDRDAAQAQLSTALGILLARAARIPDPHLRISYLEDVADNAELLALSDELSGDWGSE